MRLWHLTALYCLALASCAIGIPSAADIKPPPPPEPCKPIYVDGVPKACLSDDALRRWMRRNTTP